MSVLPTLLDFEYLPQMIVLGNIFLVEKSFVHSGRAW